ncbi:MAG: hypothetical protein R3B49_02670 [Phycisphaerales bacterium]
MTHPKALVISDGSLPALVATAIVSEDAASGAKTPATDLPGIVWCVAPIGPDADALRPACERAAGRQADVYGLGFLSTGEARATEEWLADGPPGQPETMTLIRAAYLAAQHQCRRVIWPVLADRLPGSDTPDLASVARAIDRALLAGRLASLDLDRGEWTASGVPEVRIETPFADLTDAQLADLSRDLEVPAETCWWWGGDGLPGAGEERARWQGLTRPTAEPKPRMPVRTR